MTISNASRTQGPIPFALAGWGCSSWTVFRNQQHSQLVQHWSPPACPSAQGWEQNSFPSFSTAESVAIVQSQGSQAQVGVGIAMGRPHYSCLS